MDKRIGMIGLGQMGKWMALNMLKREFDLTVLDINPAALTSLTGEGARAAATPADLASQTDFGPRILEGRFNDAFLLKHANKDMVSAAEICAQRKIPLPLVHDATTTYQLALAAGYGDNDKGAMIKVFENILGIAFRKN